MKNKFLTLLLVTFNHTVFFGKFFGKSERYLFEQSTSTLCIRSVDCTSKRNDLQLQLNGQSSCNYINNKNQICFFFIYQ